MSQPYSSSSSSSCEAFGRNVASPYMSMAPRVVEPIRALYPALAHVDGTARHQSVGKGDEPWIHALLLAVGRRIGLAALINTSFNTILGKALEGSFPNEGRERERYDIYRDSMGLNDFLFEGFYLGRWWVG